ncbi:8-didemethyl-8-hydroxy-5-deazariboflavin synthase [Durusdinium trenchii]|uniref:8-didemethyl-8-hydroxy-5-deazariboflavin synthase n=1 Tax=Durusdinium trenchii TaxID=1381693 RepID=A0ABP0N4K5_9DINO
MRSRAVGGEVTYVVNRNINFTNVCVKRCGFCAFSRTGGKSDEGYFLPLEEILRRATEAQELGATEVCVQAGLPPNMHPDLHLHAFSPEEVLWGAKRSNLAIRDYLLKLKDAGVDSLPGTSAEILDNELRAQVSKGRPEAEDAGDFATPQLPRVRSTCYEIVRRFQNPAVIVGSSLSEEQGEMSHSALDVVDAKSFGSFHQLISSPDHRFASKRASKRVTTNTTTTGLGGVRGVHLARTGNARHFSSEPDCMDGCVRDPLKNQETSLSSVSRRRITYSPSFTLVPTFECFNLCTYCHSD